MCRTKGMVSRIESCGFRAEDLRERNGEFHLVGELNECRMGAIRLLLRGQSEADASAFDAAVEQRKQQGYELKSLLIELRCPTGESVSKNWTWDVQPKVDAKPQQSND